jgi:hypothetical protein
MSKRSLSLIAACGLIASLAFGTPSQAGSVPINVSESFSLYDSSITDTISSVVFTFTNSEYGGMINTMTAAKYTGVATTLGPPTGVVAPTITTDATPSTDGTFTLSFSPSVFSVGGTISFDTMATTSDVSTLQADIKLKSVTIVTPEGTDVLTTTPLNFTVLTVPEPASMGLLGIGMAGFFAFRRFSRKRATKV